MKTNLVVVALLFAFACSVQADDFFKINKIRFLEKPAKEGQGIYTYEAKPGKTHAEQADFIPCLEVSIRLKDVLHPSQLTAKAYFYDSKRKLLATASQPDPVERSKTRNVSSRFPWPSRVGKKEKKIYFKVPQKVLNTERWQALVVFGDKQGVTVQSYPIVGDEKRLKFPEKKLAKSIKRIDRKMVVPGLFEYVQKTPIKAHPQITFFVRKPEGVSDLKEAKGTLAICLVAFDVEHVKRQLDGTEDSIQRFLDFADQKKLAILCWGMRVHWNSKYSWDELKETEAEKYDYRMSQIADAWTKAVETLHKKHGLPKREMLLVGGSNAAQFALRLALRKPEYFLAVHASIPTSFDKPTPEGKDVIWCLTVGELDGGYAASLRFLKECKSLGYPIIYKAAIGAGHHSTPATRRLGLQVFEYALALRDEKERMIEEHEGGNPSLKLLTSNEPLKPWPKEFQKPPYIGDAVNQEHYPSKDIEMVPDAFRVPIPTKEMASTWQQEK